MSEVLSIGGFLAAAIVTFLVFTFGLPALLLVARIFGIYTTVDERTCKVYVLFGKVLATIDEPGLHFLLGKLGPAAFVVNILGRCYELDLRLDQEYRRSEPV